MEDSQIVAIAEKLDGELRRTYLESVCDVETRQRIENQLASSDQHSATDIVEPSDPKPVESKQPLDQPSIWTDSPANVVKRSTRYAFRNIGKIAATLAILALLLGGVYLVTQSTIRSRQLADAANLARKESATNEQTLQQSLSLIKQSFSSASPESHADHAVTANQVLIAARESILTSELNERGKLDLFTTIIEAFRLSDQYHSAKETAEQQVEFCKQQFGETAVETLTAQNRLVECLELTGHRTEAWDLQSEIQIGLQNTVGQGHPEHKRGAMHKGVHLAVSNIYARFNRPEKESGYYKRAQGQLESIIPDLKNLFGEYSDEVMDTMRILAQTAVAAKDFDLALKTSKQLFQLHKEQVGVESAATSNALRDLMLIYLETEPKQGIEFVQTELDAYESRLGKDHPTVIMTQKILALGYQRLGDLDRALELRQTIDTALVDLFGVPHPETVISGCNLAQLYFLSGLSQNSDRILAQRLPLEEDSLANVPMSVLHNLEVAAKQLESIEQLDRANQILETVLQTRLARQGTGRIATLTTKKQLADSYVANERTFDSLQLIVDAHEQARAQLENNLETGRIGFVACVTMGVALVEVEQMISEGDFRNAENYLKIMVRYHGPYTSHYQRESNKHYVDVLLAQGRAMAASRKVADWQRWIELQTEKSRKARQKRDSQPETEQVFPEDQPVPRAEIAAMIAARSVCQLIMGEIDAAYATAQQALKTRSIGVLDRIRCKCVGAVYQAHQNDLESAEKQAIEAFALAESVQDSDPRALSLAMPLACDCLIKIYKLSNNEKEVQNWQNKLKEIKQKLRSQRVIAI